MENFLYLRLIEGLNILQIPATEDQLLQVLDYVSLLDEYNRKFNLTGYKTQETILYELILDSLSILSTGFSFNQFIYAIDVGTGAGIPGIPLKIFLPHLHFCFIDSNHKKINFLKFIAERLSLLNVSFVSDRAEVIGHNPYFRENFDLAFSRALSTLASNIELVTPFLKRGYKAIFYKGISYQEEIEASINALTALNCKVSDVQKMNIPFVERINYFIIIEKYSFTPASYPRRNGLPQKKPL